MALLLSVLEQGMIYGILALGVYITYKILDFPDLTVDGSFPFGAAITVRLINGFGVPAILTLPIAFLGGALVGICTGLIHVKLKVRDLLSGIIMMTGLYTINLWVAGSGYVAIFDKDNIFNNSFVNSITPGFFCPYEKMRIPKLKKIYLIFFLSLKFNFIKFYPISFLKFFISLTTVTISLSCIYGCMGSDNTVSHNLSVTRQSTYSLFPENAVCICIGLG